MKLFSLTVFVILMSCSSSTKIAKNMKHQDDQILNLTVKYNDITTKKDSLLKISDELRTKNLVLNARIEEYDKINKHLKTFSKTIKNIRARLVTSQGTMEIVFFPEFAPLTVLNFVKLAEGGFYNGIQFHRVINGFMIQTGDPNTKHKSMMKKYGQGGSVVTIPEEFSMVPHSRGVLSMARSSSVNSASSQFFIVHKGASSLDGKYTVFGKVIKGLDVLDKIATTKTYMTNKSFPPNYPVKPITIKTIEIFKWSANIKIKNN